MITIRAVTHAFVFRFRARLVWQRWADCSYFFHTATFGYFWFQISLDSGKSAPQARKKASDATSSHKNYQFYLSIYLQLSSEIVQGLLEKHKLFFVYFNLVLECSELDL